MYSPGIGLCMKCHARLDVPEEDAGPVFSRTAAAEI